VRNGKRTGNCRVCGTKLKDNFVQCCSYKCHNQKLWENKVDDFESKGIISASSDGGIRKFLRKYLFDKHGNVCQICNGKEWMGNPIPLLIDHKDGNPENHNIKNIRLICGNCDMLLPTYKSRNRGKGRKYRRDNYRKNKRT